MDIEYLISLAVALFLLNVAVSVFLIRRDDLERFQKVAQAFIVWLVPIVGAIFVWRLNKKYDAPLRVKTSFTVGNDGVSVSDVSGGGD
jgi:hypothetical protein